MRFDYCMCVIDLVSFFFYYNVFSWCSLVCYIMGWLDDLNYINVILFFLVFK